MSGACQYLHDALSRMSRLKFKDLEKIPANGVYVLFENGETAHGGERIVRIGTHRGQNNLAKRIREHLYTPNKDRSIFRKHVGRCLLTKAHDPFIDQWEIDLTTKKSRELNAHKVDKKKLQKIESEVSAYMNDNFSFAIMRFEKRSERFHVERSLLSTVSQCSGCGPTEHWLGKYHPNSVIRESGLLNIQWLDSLPSTLDEVCQIVQAGTIEGI